MGMVLSKEAKSSCSHRAQPSWGALGQKLWAREMGGKGEKQPHRHWSPAGGGEQVKELGSTLGSVWAGPTLEHGKIVRRREELPWTDSFILLPLWGGRDSVKDGQVGSKGKLGLGRKFLRTKVLCVFVSHCPPLLELAINKFSQGRSVFLEWWLVSELPVFVPTHKYGNFLPLPWSLERGSERGAGWGKLHTKPIFWLLSSTKLIWSD